MAAPAPQQGSQSDNSSSMLWYVAAAFAAIGAIWYAFQKYIVIAYLTVKLYEMRFLEWVNSYIGFQSNFDSLYSNILSALVNPASVTLKQLLVIGSDVGVWLRWPFIIIFFVLAVIVYLGNTARFFKKTYNMRELAQLEKVNWPQITPIVNLDLVKEDIDKGPWAMAMTPMQFCKRLGLLEEVRQQRREGMSRKEWDRIDVVLKRGEANKVFALQLGALWQGTQKLPPHTKALFAAFAARINSDTKAAADLLMQLNLSSTGKLNLSGVDALIKKYENTKLVQKVVQTHAYVLTVMAAMLEAAREDGVQASADFLWLKPLDRRLWYTLNVVGRQTPFAEIAGIYAHWLAEKETGYKLLVPVIEEATKALEIALKEVVYKRDEA